jgi:hypothetical protein
MSGMSATELAIALLSEIAEDKFMRGTTRQRARECLRVLTERIEVEDLIARCREESIDETRDRMTWEKLGR